MELFISLLGTITALQLFFLVAGLIVSLIIFIDGKKDSEKSWFRRNWLKMAASIILAYVGVLLGPDIFKLCGITLPEGSNAPNVHAFLCGFLSDVILFGLRRLKEKLSGQKTNDAKAV